MANRRYVAGHINAAMDVISFLLREGIPRNYLYLYDILTSLNEHYSGFNF